MFEPGVWNSISNQATDRYLSTGADSRSVTSPRPSGQPPATQWNITGGLRYDGLVLNRDEGMALASDGKAVFLAEPNSTDSRQQWRLQRVNTTRTENFYFLVHVPSQNVLDSNEKGEVYLSARDGKIPNRVWYLDASYVLVSQGIVISYDEIDDEAATPEIMGRAVLRNRTSASVASLTQQFESNKASSFEFGLTETLGVSLTLQGEVGIPLLASTKSSITLSVEVSASETWTSTVAMDFLVATSVDVEPGGEIEVKGLLSWVDDVTVPFHGSSIISAPFSAIDHHDVVQSYSFQSIINYLRETGCRIDLRRLDPKSVLATFDGQLRGAWAITAEVDVAEVTKDSSAFSGKPA